MLHVKSCNPISQRLLVILRQIVEHNHQIMAILVNLKILEKRLKVCRVCFPLPLLTLFLSLFSLSPSPSSLPLPLTLLTLSLSLSLSSPSPSLHFYLIYTSFLFLSDAEQINPQVFEGCKVSLGKGLSRYFQTTHTVILGSNSQPNSYQYGVTYVGSKKLAENDVRKYPLYK